MNKTLKLYSNERTPLIIEYENQPGIRDLEIRKGSEEESYSLYNSIDMDFNFIFKDKIEKEKILEVKFNKAEVYYNGVLIDTMDITTQEDSGYVLEVFWTLREIVIATAPTKTELQERLTIRKIKLNG